MAIGNANVTTGKTFVNAEDVTTASLNTLGVPTVALAFSGDTNTGLSNPSADVLAVEVGGAEVCRFTATGIATKFNIFRDVNNAGLGLYGGTSGNGANIELYGGTHATLTNYALVDADVLRIRPQDGSSNRMSVNSSGVTIGNTGNAIKAIWHTTKTVSLTAVGAVGTAYADVTVTGAAVGDGVIANVTDSGFDNVTVEAFVYSPDTVRIFFKNPSATARNVAGDIAVMVFDVT